MSDNLSVFYFKYSFADQKGAILQILQHLTMIEYYCDYLDQTIQIVQANVAIQYFFYFQVQARIILNFFMSFYFPCHKSYFTRRMMTYGTNYFNQLSNYQGHHVLFMVIFQQHSFYASCKVNPDYLRMRKIVLVIIMSLTLRYHHYYSTI